MPSAFRLALATCSAAPDLYDDEQALPALLRARGVDPHVVVWSDEGVDWRSFDRVVLRSTWDYFEREPEFRRWLGALRSHGVELLNPYEIVLWNLDKRYLLEVEAKGSPIVPTVFVERGEAFDLARTMRERGWSDAVVKPSVSGAAFRTHRVSVETMGAAQTAVDGMLRDSGALLQPFMRAIQDEGEWSLFFFDGAFSHAVLKTAAKGDYRVQPVHGGAAAAIAPDDALLAAAKAAIGTMPAPPRYVRIDGVRDDGRFLLMEIEAIEPYLFLGGRADAMARYVDAITRV